MTRRRKKTDGERIAARLFCLEIDDMEPAWLATQIDRIIKKREREAWKAGYNFREVVAEIEADA